MDGNDLLVVPKQMEKEVIAEAHSAGHFAIQKTAHGVQQFYWIPHLQQKVQQLVRNCVKCIIFKKKLGKKEGFLNCIDKGDTPLHTLHFDHVGPMDATAKQYKYILSMVDSFSKFVWLFPTKTTSCEETLRKIKTWSEIFGNPVRIVSDRGSAFTANVFAEYAKENGIAHVWCTMGVPRGNGQIERVNSTVLSIISKISSEDTSKWFKAVPDIQRAVNSHVHSSTKRSPFELKFGVRMNNKPTDRIMQLLQEEMYENFDKERQQLRQNARNEIQQAQDSYKKQYDSKRRPEIVYQVGDLVAIRRTQFIAGKKLASEFLGPYEVTKVKRNGRYDVRKAADVEGPTNTSTSCGHMKLWRYTIDNEDA